MRIIFMGTPDFSVGTLEALVEAGHEVCLVVTQPDKPKGRGKEKRSGKTKRGREKEKARGTFGIRKKAKRAGIK